MDPIDELLGTSAPIAALRASVRRLLAHQAEARRLSPILLEGETGTGKGLLAHTLHRASTRHAGPFVDLNCAAIPETLLESELFGFARGAFTDARAAKPGLFQTAHQGTLFIDEVGLLSPSPQAKLLKVIEERSVRRLGSTRSEPVDVWIVAATNEELRAAVRAGRFREDLYHRLAVLTVSLPPLRERGDDVLLLAEHFLSRACSDYGLPLKRLGSDAEAALLAYAWPGNVRELANLMERVALLSEDPVATAATLSLSGVAGREKRLRDRPDTPTPGGDATEREALVEALRATNWNITRAAARLGISRNTIRYRIEKHRLRAEARPVTRRPPAPPYRQEAPADTAAAQVEARVVPGVRWERRRITFVRAGIAAPAASLPSEVSRLLEVLVEKTLSFGGVVQELRPATIIAAFGLVPVEDAPRHAANAGLAMQRAVARVRASGMERAGGVRIALHAAEVMVGHLAGATEIDQDAKRETWTALENLVAGADCHTILVTAATAPFLARRFELAPLGPPPTAVYRLSGPERSGPRLGGPISEFFGRQHEIDLLQSRLERATKGQGQVVGISGDPGIGKSRLLHEFRKTLAGQPVDYLETRCVSYGSAIPYLSVLEIIRASFKLEDTDTPDAMAEKVGAGLADLGLDPAERLPHLLHLLGVTDDAEELVGLGPEAVKARIFETLRHLCLRRSQRRPLIIAVEDLHWIDKTSEEAFAALVETVAGAGILMLATHRAGYRTPWIEKSYATQIALQPLPPEESVRILRPLLAPGEVGEALVKVILSKAEGNPFFLEELARAVHEQGERAALSVPDTIEEVLLTRIDLLPPEEKRLLQAAAVIGRDVAVALLAAITDLEAAALHRALTSLRTGEFLYERGLGTEPEYMFKHALTQDVAYGSLLEEERCALHARIVDAMERFYPDRLTEHVDQLARQALNGRVWGKAAKYFREAGARAAGRSAYREAVICFLDALVALGRLEPTRETLAQDVDVRFELRNALWALGDLARGLEYLREAEPLAEALGDQRRLARLAIHTSSNYLVLGENERALECGERALALATALDDFALRIDGNQFLGVLHNSLGDYSRAIEFLETNLAALVGERLQGRFGEFYAVLCRTWLVWALSELGRFDEATARAAEAREIAEGSGYPHNLVAAWWGLGYLHRARGDLVTAIPVLERGHALCRTADIALWLRPCAALLGHAYSLAGRIPEGLPLLERAVEADENNVGLAAWESYLGEALMLAGRLDDATERGRHALALASKRKERGFHAWTLRLLAEIAERRREDESAENHYREALALAEARGMRPLTARCRLGLGLLHRRAGKLAQADEHLRAAARMLREMAMRPPGLDPATFGEGGHP